MAKISNKVFSKTSSRRMNLQRYSFYMASGAFIFWSIVLGIGAYSNFQVNDDQATSLSSRSMAITIAWIVFVTGFVSGLSAALRSRRGLHIGFLEPSEQEKAKIENYHRIKINGIWLPVLLSTFGFIVFGAGICFSWLEFSGNTNKLVVALFSVMFPSISAAAISWWNSRHSVLGLLNAQKQSSVTITTTFRYSLFQNAIPYALFFSAMGIAIAIWRFSEKQRGGDQVSTAVFCRHLSATSFFIGFFLTSAARAKAKIDFLGPFKFRSFEKSKMLHHPWRLWYSLIIPPAIYAVSRGIFFATSIENIPKDAAIAIKGVFCLIVGLWLCIWAVQTILAEMISDGIDQHPYVRFRKFLQKTKTI